VACRVCTGKKLSRKICFYKKSIIFVVQRKKKGKDMERINNTHATLEGVWAAFMETDRLIKESKAKSEQDMAQLTVKLEILGDKIEKTNEILGDKIEKTNEILTVKLEKTNEILGGKIEKVNEMLGGIANSNGMFAEEYFVNSFDQSKHNLFGEHFDKIEKKIKGFDAGFEDEYDILLINGKSVGIVEVKYKARLEDVAKVLKKANTFRVNYPKYKDHQVYLGLATLISSDRIEQECIREGIAFVKQVGNSVVINDKNLKIF
jgi:hypothetical protein